MSSDNLEFRRVAKALKGILGYKLSAGDHSDLVDAAKQFRLPDRDAKKVAAWFMAKFPERFEEQKARTRGDLKCLIDENTSYSIIPKLRYYGRVSSVSFENWQGKKDCNLYPDAEKQGFDCIFTQDIATRSVKDSDVDISDIALKTWAHFVNLHGIFARVNAPVLIRFPTEKPQCDGSFDVLFREVDFISYHVRERTHAFINVRPEGVHLVPQTSMLGLFEAARLNLQGFDGANKKREETISLPREFAQAIRFSKRLASQNHVSIQTTINKVREQVVRDYDHHLKKNGHMNVDDLFKILDLVLKRFGGASDAAGILVLEKALKTVMQISEQNSFSISSKEDGSAIDVSAVPA